MFVSLAWLCSDQHSNIVEVYYFFYLFVSALLLLIVLVTWLFTVVCFI